MMRMVRECDRSQRKLAAFLITVVILEVTFICAIIRHEHVLSREDFGGKLSSDPHVHEREFRSNQTNKAKLLKVIPKPVPEAEQRKWISSTTLDFKGFGEGARRLVYDVTRSGFADTKSLQTKDVGILRDNCSVPPVTSYGIDYRMHSVHAPQIKLPVPIHFSQNTLRGSKSSNMKMGMLSEARHAFQWPTADRVRMPMHLR